MGLWGSGILGFWDSSVFLFVLIVCFGFVLGAGVGRGAAEARKE